MIFIYLAGVAHRRHAARPVHDPTRVSEPARVERLGRAARAELDRLLRPVAGAFGIDQAPELRELGLGPGIGLGLVRILDDDPLLLPFPRLAQRAAATAAQVPPGRGYSPGRPLRGPAFHRHQQAGRPRRPSGPQPPLGHAAERPGPPLPATVP